MILDFIVVAMTLLKTVRLNRGVGGRTILHVLMRDSKSIQQMVYELYSTDYLGVAYFG